MLHVDVTTLSREELETTVIEYSQLARSLDERNRHLKSVIESQKAQMAELENIVLVAHTFSLAVTHALEGPKES